MQHINISWFNKMKCLSLLQCSETTMKSECNKQINSEASADVAGGEEHLELLLGLLGQQNQELHVGLYLLVPLAGPDMSEERSSVLVLLERLSSETDGLLPAGALLDLGQNQRVDHGHVDVQVVGLLEALPAHQTLKVQVGLGLVLGHVILQGRSLAALEPTHLTPGQERPDTHSGFWFP